MTKDIILTISGLHAVDGESDEPVEILTPGQYYLKNGKHYILFDEVMEGMNGVIKSRLKISEKDKQVELLRNGGATARMVFGEEQEHSTIYNTPVGQLQISIYTEKVGVKVSEDKIDVSICYSVMTGGQVVTESEVNLNVCPKELKKF